MLGQVEGFSEVEKDGYYFFFIIFCMRPVIDYLYQFVNRAVPWEESVLLIVGPEFFVWLIMNLAITLSITLPIAESTDIGLQSSGVIRRRCLLQLHFRNLLMTLSLEHWLVLSTSPCFLFLLSNFRNIIKLMILKIYKYRANSQNPSCLFETPKSNISNKLVINNLIAIYLNISSS